MPDPEHPESGARHIDGLGIRHLRLSGCPANAQVSDEVRLAV
jgi:hypothetical protein